MNWRHNNHIYRQCLLHSTKFFLVELLMASFIPAQAATITWTNTSGGNWSVAANWSPNQVPGVADTALIETNGSYTVTLNANAQIAGLRSAAPVEFKISRLVAARFL
jgi:hypothetical protein